MKIILAVDLFETSTHKNPDIFMELNNWTDDFKSKVQPVYVHSSSLSQDVAMEQISSLRTELVEKMKAFKDLKVLHLPPGGRRKQIEALLSYAAEEKADLIALVSQSKGGEQKKILGSFAETLLLKAECPILFLEEEIQNRTKLDKVLFATDFSDMSREGFSIFLKSIQKRKPEIVIFNAIPLPQLAVAGNIYSQALNLLPQHYWDEQRRLAEDKGQKLLEMAQARGFTAKLEIANQVYSIENAIHEVAKREQVRLLAMISVSSPLQSFLLGSVSRSILKTRVKPIWICGPLCLGNL